MIGGVENPVSAAQVEPHDGGAGTQLLEDIEAAVTALKQESAVLDVRDKTVDVIQLLNAKIAEVRAVRALRQLGRTGIAPRPVCMYRACRELPRKV
jgi:hypothetical protein